MKRSSQQKDNQIRLKGKSKMHRLLLLESRAHGKKKRQNQKRQRSYLEANWLIQIERRLVNA
ncbi:MAG: hypothetical protein ACQES4_01305 [Bacillota bacterium]